MKSLKKRLLHLESLENRILLSVTPTFASIPPTGTQAVYWMETIELKANESTQIAMDTVDLDSVTIFCVNHNQVPTFFQSHSSSFSSSTNYESTINTSNYDTSTIKLENFSSRDGVYTLYAVSNSDLEKELLGKETNNTFSEKVQSLKFSPIPNNLGNQSGTSSVDATCRQAVVLGELNGEQDFADCYQMMTQGGTVNFQLHSFEGVPCSLELYDSNQNILAYSTSVDDFNSVLSSVTLSEGNYFLRVTASEVERNSTNVGKYALTVTENYIVETGVGVESSLINHLNASGVGLGMINDSETPISETLSEFTGEKIRAFSVSESRMATVTYVPQDKNGAGSVTLRLLEYSASTWHELASITYDSTNTEGTGIDISTFGQNISVSGNSILVGDANHNLAQIYTRNGKQLLATTLNVPTASDGDKLGASVLLQGNYAFISAPGSDLNGTDSGAVYVFQRSATSWNLVGTLAIQNAPGVAFGSVLAWDSTSSRLCITCGNESVSMLYIFRVSASEGLVQESILDGSVSSENFSSQGQVTDFGRAVAISGNTLAVSCRVETTNTVRIYAWNEETCTWNAVTELQTPDDDPTVTNFGGSISLAGTQLAVGSNVALNKVKNLGIVYLYRANTTGVQAVWELDRTIQHTEEGALGNGVVLNANRLDVWDSLQNRIYTFSNFSNVDRWTLNVTGTEPITLKLSVQKTAGTLPKIEILDPNGLSIAFESEKNDSSTAQMCTFMPKIPGIYTFVLSADEMNEATDTEYRLEVTSGVFTEYLDAGVILEVSDDLSTKITVEYAQQILVSSLTDAVAQLGNMTLQNPQLIDGNKVVWSVTDNLPNGQYPLTISGLESVSGAEIPVLATDYKFVNPIPTAECTLDNNRVILDLSEKVDSLTLSNTSITVKNNVTGEILSPVSYTILNNGYCVEFTFTETLGIGDWTITITENALLTESKEKFSFGTSENYGDSIRIDTLAPDVESITVDTKNGTATIVFTESIEAAELWLTGAGYGEIRFTEMVQEGNSLTVKWNPMSDTMSLLPDLYTFRVTALMDAAGNYAYADNLSENAVKTFAITAESGQILTISDSEWERATMDGAFAYNTTLVGYVMQDAPMNFKIPYNKGEFLTYFMVEDENSGKIQTAWNAETGILTVSAPTLTAEEGVTFKILLFRNTTIESNSKTNPEIGAETELQFVTLATVGNTTIRQTSVSGTLATTGETDTYRFTISGKSSFSAAFTSPISGQATLNLYEVLPDGNKLWLASSDSATDTLDACFQNIINTANSDVMYLLQVSATGTGSYNLVVTENAQFNGITNGTRDNALLLDTQKTVIGHVSQESDVIQPETIQEAFLGYSVVASGNFLFVGIPGNSTSGENAGSVAIYEFDGLKYKKVADLTASDTAMGDCFGTNLVLEGNTLLVSAPNHKNAGSNNANGAVYAFTWNGDGTFTQTHKIVNPTMVPISDFGSVMDYSDGLLAVGTQTSGENVWAFQLNSNGQYQSYRLYENALNQAAFYGFSVAVDNGNILVSAPGTQTYTDTTGNTITVQGAVLFYQWNGFRYECVQQFIPAESDSLLGYSVAMENGLAVMVAYNTEGVILYTADLSSFNASQETAPTVMRTTLTHISATGTVDRTVRLKDGILSLAGFTKENTALLLKLNGNTWEILQTSPLPQTQTEIANNSYGFDSTQGGHTHFVAAPNAFTNSFASGKVYTFDYQDDYYRFTAASDTITVTLQAAAMYTGLNATGAGNITLLAELTDANGEIIIGSATNNQYSFQVTAGTEYYLRLATADGSALDYVLTVNGIVQNLPTLEMESLVLYGKNGNELSMTEKLSERPTSITLNFSNKIRADRLSTASVQIFNGKENVSATSYTVSADGKSVTFQFSSEMVYFTTVPQLKINANDFCTVAGGILTLDGQAENGTATVAFQMNGVSVTNRLRASETSASLVWKFSENVLTPHNGWENAVSVTRTRSGSTENITTHGTFSYADGVLTWTATYMDEIQTDDILCTELNAEKVVTESRIPLLGLTQSENGDFQYVKTFTVNLNGVAETRLGIRTESSLSLVDATNATVETLPENADWVHEWNTIWVEVWGRVVSTTENGLTSYSAQVSYDPKVFTPFDAKGNITFEWNRNVFESVTVIDAGNNTLTITATTKEGNESVGASNGETDAGYALITSIQFLPKYGKEMGASIQFAEDGVTHKPTEAGIGFVKDSISIQDTNGQSLDGNTEDMTGILPGVYPVVYDLNDDGTININDLVQFARNFGRTSSYSESAAACNFDGQGEVNIQDLVLFARNFQKTGNAITFTESLTKNWGVAEIAEILPTNSISTLEVASLASVSEIVSGNGEAKTTETPLFQTVGNVSVTDWTALMPLAKQEAQNREQQETELRAQLLKETLADTENQAFGVTETESSTETSDDTAMWEFLAEAETNKISEYEWDFSVNNTEKDKD